MNIKKINQMFGEYLISDDNIIKYFAESYSEHNLESVIRAIISLDVISRKEGVVYLEDFCEHIKDPFFQKTLQFVMDGYPTKFINEICENRYNAEIEKLNLHYKILQQGFCGIYDELNPREIEEKLQTLAGNYDYKKFDETKHKLVNKKIDFENEEKKNKYWKELHKYYEQEKKESVDVLRYFNSDNRDIVIKSIKFFAEIRREDGLLALEKYLSNIADSECVMLINMLLAYCTDETSSKFKHTQFNKINELIETLKEKRIYEKKMYLRLIAKGMMLLQKDFNPFEMYEYLYAIIGKDIYFDFKNKFSENEKNKIFSDLFKKIKNSDVFRDYDKLLKYIGQYHLRKVIKTTDVLILSLAYAGSSAKIKESFRENIKSSLFQWMNDFAALFATDNETIETDIIEAMRRIIGNIIFLERNEGLMYSTTSKIIRLLNKYE